MWLWPLTRSIPEVPRAPEPGAFGVARKFDIHTGVDLYCEPDETVLAVESGLVTSVVPFTGPQAESPWWLETFALTVQNEWWTVVYGEVARDGLPAVGATIEAGQPLGRVARVLRHDKGLPTTMLHFEVYNHPFVAPVWWHAGQPKPYGLLNPTDLLIAARGHRVRKGS